MEKKRAPGHVIAIAVLGLLFIIAAMAMMFMTAAGGDYLALGVGLLAIGLVLSIVGGGLARKYVKQGGSS